MTKLRAMSVFCQNVRELLIVREMTHEQAAEQLGITRSNFSRMLRGLHAPRLDLVERVAVVLGVSVSDLLTPGLDWGAAAKFEKVA